MKEKLPVFHNLPSGGGAGALASMMPFLRERFDVRVHCPEGSADVCGPDPEGLREWPFPEGLRIRGSRRLLGPMPFIRRLDALDSLCLRIAAEIDSLGAPCALVHNSMYVAAPPLLRHLRTPSLYYCYEFPRHIHDPDIIRRTRNGLLEMLLLPLSRREASMDECAVRAASRVVTLSSYMASRLRGIYGVDAGVVRPGVDSSFLHPGSNPRDGGYALSVGALWPYKGHSLFLAASARAGLREAVIVADREYPGFRRTLEGEAAGLGMRLLILQGIDRREVRSIYRSAAVVVCCQRAEPYGLVPLEAMACGRPVVAVREGGFVENIEDGVTGLLVERDLEAVASAVARVVGDKALSGSLGSAGRDFVTSRRSPGSAASALIGELLLAGNPAGPRGASGSTGPTCP